MSDLFNKKILNNDLAKMVYEKWAKGKGLNINDDNTKQSYTENISESIKIMSGLSDEDVKDLQISFIPPPPKMERQRSYEITEQERYEARRDAVSFIINNSQVNRQQLENKSDRQVAKIYNRLLKRMNDRMEGRGQQPQMRTPSQIDLKKMVEIQDRTERETLLKLRERFSKNPSLRRQARMIAGETMSTTRLPLALSRLIGEYASEPDIRLKTIPTGMKRRPRTAVSFAKIITEQGGDFSPILDGSYKTKDGTPVTKISQLSDYVLKQIYDDFSDEELKLFIDPELPDDSSAMLELKAIREALSGKKTVTQAEEIVKKREEDEKKRQEDKEKEIIDTKEAVRISQEELESKYDFEDEEEKVKEKPRLKAADLFKPIGYPMVEPKIETFWIEKEEEKLETIPEENRQYDYALLNKAIYNRDPESVLERSPRGKKFDILEEDVNYMVVENKINGQITLVLKGTDIKDVKGQRKDDLIQDVGILLNNEDMVSRTKEMDIIAKRLLEEYDDIDVTGHSLSGYMANKISKDNGIDAIVFNMGSSPFKKSSREENPNLVHYTTNVGTNIDPISLTAARIDNFETIQVQPNQDIGSGIIKYHTIDHFLEKEKENVGINKMESLENILSRADIEPEREQRDPLADSVVRRVNQNFSFMENPLVPERNQNAVRGIIQDNSEMRNDPNPNIEPNQPILVQDEILEGDESRMPEAEAENEIGRIANRNIAATNMSSMEQNYFFREQNDIRRRQMRILGQPQGEEYDIEEKDELEEKDEGLDNGDDLPFVGGSSNRELVEAQMKRMSNQRRGKWAGVDRGNSEDWRRIMSAKAKADDLITAKAVNYLRDKQIPWKAPSRTYANSYVGLIRNSNMAMTNAVGELLP